MIPPLDGLRVLRMASGDDALLLTERVSWEAFPAYAVAVLRLIDGAIVDRVDGPVKRVWIVKVAGQQFWLAYDDGPASVSLESQDQDASRLIPGIHQKLLDLRAKTRG
jgi:hypothetical protein